MKKVFFGLFYWFRPPWDSGVPVPELQRAIANLPPGNALDLGGTISRDAGNPELPNAEARFLHSRAARGEKRTAPPMGLRGQGNDFDMAVTLSCATRIHMLRMI